MREILPSGWTVKKASEYCLKVADGTHDTPKPVAEGRPLITSKNLDGGRINYDGAYMISQADYHQINKRSKVDRWDVLFSMIGTVGEIALIRTEPDFAIKNIGLFKSKTKEDGVWLYYYLTSSIGQAALDTYLSGTSQQFVALGDLRKVPVIIPTAKSKTKIAAILSAYDELIENNKRRIALLEKLAEEIYHEWFVRLRFPGHKKAKVFKGVPQGWERMKAVALTSYLKRGVAPKYDDFAEGIAINQKCIRDGKLDLSFARRQSREVSTDRQVKHGDVLVNSTGEGTLGRVAQVLAPIANCIVDSHVTIVRPKSGVPIHYFGMALKAWESNFSIMGRGATNQTELAPSVIGGVEVVMPSKPLQNEFELHAEPLFSQITQLTAQIERLARTRDLLLPRLISGKLPVENLDIQFPPGMAEESASA